MANAYGFDKGSKVSRISTWIQVEKSSGFIIESLLNKPQLDDNLVYLWSIFKEVRKGCNKISYNDLHAYNKLTCASLSAWECQTLINIDEAWRSNG